MKKTLGSLEDVVGSISKEEKKSNKQSIEMTSEIKIEKAGDLSFEKRVAKVSVTFRAKASIVNRLDEILKKAQTENPRVTKTDIYNLFLNKGLEAMGF